LWVFLSVILLPYPGESQSPGEKNVSTQNATKGFVENRGQFVDTDGNLIPDVLFKFQSNGVDVYLTRTGIAYVYTRVNRDSISDKRFSLSADEFDSAEYTYDTYRTDLTLLNSNTTAEIIKEDPSDHYLNYYYAHCPEGITYVKSFQRITYKNIYPNIDWVLYPHQSEQGTFIKYDFIVHPRGDPDNIRMLYDGFEKIGLSQDGELILENTLGMLIEHKPIVYQGDENVIDSKFILEKDQISFEIELYDINEILTIDPSLVWATYYGGNSTEQTGEIAMDKALNIFVCGVTFSTNLPVINAFQALKSSSNDGFLAKYDSSGTLLWATYYGGTNGDNAYRVAVDESDNVIILGRTNSIDLPVFAAFQDTLCGGNDSYVVKMNPSGLRIWATYFGGSDHETSGGVAIDPWNNIIISGGTASTDFPILNPFQGTFAGGQDIYLSKLDSNGTLIWSSYYGGTGGEGSFALESDKSGNFAVTGNTSSSNFPVLNAFQSTFGGGWDVFILMFDKNNNRKWATFYGGSLTDEGTDITIDTKGGVAVSGVTSSLDLMLVNASQPFYGGGSNDGFVIKYDSAGVLNWSTYIGGGSHDNGDGIDVDQSHFYYVSGMSRSNDFPIAYAYQDTNRGDYDAFIVKFDSLGNTMWSTLYGGSVVEFGSSILSDELGHLFMGGWTSSTDIDVKNAYQDSSGGAYDSYLIKLDDTNSCSYFTLLKSTICNGDSIFIGGLYQYSAGVYIDSLKTVSNCDSLILVTLSIDMSFLIPDTVSICLGDSIFLGGIYRFSTGLYYDSLTTIYGCDSIFVTTLIVDSSFNDTTFLSICNGDSVLLGGYYQYSTGIYHDSSTTASGCDSILISVLTMYSGSYIFQSAAICSGDSILLGGSYVSTPSVYYDSLSSVNGCDSIINTVLLIDSGYIDSVDWGLCAGDSILLSGSFQAISGIFTDSLTTINGCDSIRITNLTVDAMIINSLSFSACAGDSILLGGIYQNSTGTYYDTLTGALGCDSVIISSLLVSPIFDSSLLLSICIGDSVLLEGVYQTSPSTYYDSLTSSMGCDSVIITTLFVDAVYTASLSASICSGDSILFGGMYESISGTYYDSLISVDGCDSTTIHTLTVNPSYFISVSTNICSGDSIMAGGTFQTASGSYVDSLNTISGCDSVVSMALIVSPNYFSSNTISICQGDSIFLGGMHQSNSGIYLDSLPSITGCDSIVETTLLIHPSYYFQDSVYLCFGDSIQIGGQYYSASGVYQDSLLTMLGCDSVSSTLLWFHSIYSILENESICSGDSAYIGGGYQTEQEIYIDSLSSMNGCDSVIRTQLTVTSIPTVNAGPDDTICLGASTELNAAAATNYNWSPAESLSSTTVMNPVASPKTTTHYTLTINNGDCSGEDTVAVVVLDDCSIYIADIFSPNGDGNNDKLYVQGRGIESIWFIIYDRWGEKVFETTDINKGWNGKYNGNPVNTGVYVYYAEAKFRNGTELTDKGDVTLVR